MKTPFVFNGIRKLLVDPLAPKRLHWIGLVVITSLVIVSWLLRADLSPTNRVELIANWNRVQPVQFQPARRPEFDLRDLTVPSNEIFSGGPRKDGIPALSNPAMIMGATATYLYPNDRVIGVAIGSQARAYPLMILNHHEIVNDRIGQFPIAVTYCPLCDSAAVYDCRTPLGVREFGVSGLLYNSNVLMYDRGGRPESLWSQIKTKGISGPAADQMLTVIPFELTTWKDWLTRHPKTQLLSTQTGNRRDYRRNPYAGYFGNAALMFPVRPTSNALPAKSPMLCIWTDDGLARAYPISRLGSADRTITDTIGGKNLTLVFNRQANSLRVAKADEGVHWIYSLWFAWYAFHPETSISGSP